MNRWSVRMAACLTLASALDAAAGEPSANPAYFAPQERLQLPFGYYQTQWRSFPGLGDDLSPITIVVPPVAVTAPLPAPIKIAPDLKLPEPPKPTPVLEAPPKLEKPLEKLEKKDGSKAILPSSTNLHSTSRLVLPPDEPMGSNPAIRPLVPLSGLPIQIPGLLPQATTPVIPEPLLFEKMKEPAENPAASQKPKAWLELPRPQPTVRGSSHLLEKKEPPLPPIWRAAREPGK